MAPLTLKQSNTIESPLVTCEAVISECLFRLNYAEIEPPKLFKFIKRGDLLIQSVFTNSASQERVANIITDYQNLPADFADACLVHLYERAPHKAPFFTTDSHFNIYRTKNDDTISTINPDF